MEKQFGEVSNPYNSGNVQQLKLIPIIVNNNNSNNKTYSSKTQKIDKNNKRHTQVLSPNATSAVLFNLFCQQLLILVGN